MIKDVDTYCYPQFIELKNDQIIYFELIEKTQNGVLIKQEKFSQKLSQTKYEFVAENRIRIYRIGKTLTVISETESIAEETEFATDYERIKPTITNLTREEINTLELKADWNGEEILIVFNKYLDSLTTQKLNKRHKREGRKLVLENLQGTYFASIYGNGERRMLIGIEEINTEEAVLYGFPEKPYKVIAN